ncbi:glycosyltransferase [Nocardioides sp. B-3]|uniref:glycosyltransferase n=1 Tax=Nocardioides sp. B-3 TaxID=2895565 RepID=UPI003FA60190
MRGRINTERSVLLYTARIIGCSGRNSPQLQTSRWQNWTCHVGIDGADADTLALVIEIVGLDDRFAIHHFPVNIGFYRNFERIVAAVDPGAAWVALADQDDFWHPNKLERLVAEFAADDVAAVSGQARLVNDSGVELGLTRRCDPGPFGLLLDNKVTGSFAVFRGDVVRRSLPFPEPTDAAYHDHWLGMVAAGVGRLVIVNDALQDYVQHGANVLGEERGSRLGWRAQTLRERSGSHGMLLYLSAHRWGWRVTMARVLIEAEPRGLEPRLTVQCPGSPLSWPCCAVRSRHCSSTCAARPGVCALPRRMRLARASRHPS